jgi:hypothetical protein
MAGILETMFDISPNPDYVFKPDPFENERYLMYRYVKSIFQIPNTNLVQFSDDKEYLAFCSKNNLEYHNQEWFNRLYLRGSYNDAIDYLNKCSLIFQELYFPQERTYDPIPTLHEAELLKKRYEFKDDFHDIYEILNKNNITRLYHFTDKSNIESIKRHGILSNKDLLQLGICSKYASSEDSRKIDKEMGLDSFLRLSFVKYHPMMYTSMTAYDLHPAIIEINPLVALLPNVFFSDRNCLRKGANIGQHAGDLLKVKFQPIKCGKAYYDMSLEEKMYYQAEVLIKNRIGPEMIINIFTP